MESEEDADSTTNLDPASRPADEEDFDMRDGDGDADIGADNDNQDEARGSDYDENLGLPATQPSTQPPGLDLDSSMATAVERE